MSGIDNKIEQLLTSADSEIAIEGGSDIVPRSMFAKLWRTEQNQGHAFACCDTLQDCINNESTNIAIQAYFKKVRDTYMAYGYPAESFEPTNIALMELRILEKFISSMHAPQPRRLQPGDESLGVRTSAGTTDVLKQAPIDANVSVGQRIAPSHRSAAPSSSSASARIYGEKLFQEEPKPILAVNHSKLRKYVVEDIALLKSYMAYLVEQAEAKKKNTPNSNSIGTTPDLEGDEPEDPSNKSVKRARRG